MTSHNYSISEIKHGHKSIMDACDRTMETIAKDESNCVFSGQCIQEIWANTIQTAIIQTVGRFCERYASDVLWALAKLDAFIRPSEINSEDRWVIGIGIREAGVDGNEWIISRLRDTKRGSMYVHPEYVYRKILCVDIKDTNDDYFCTEPMYRRHIELKDITSSLYKLDPGDENS